MLAFDLFLLVRTVLVQCLHPMQAPFARHRSLQACILGSLEQVCFNEHASCTDVAQHCAVGVVWSSAEDVLQLQARQ